MIIKVNFLLWIVVAFLFFIYDLSLLMLEQSLISTIAGFLAIYFSGFFLRHMLHLDRINSLLALLVLSINSSYYSILPVEYSVFPISWFIFILLKLIFISGYKMKIMTGGVTAIVAIFMVFITGIFDGDNVNISSAIKQLVNIFLFLMVCMLCTSRTKFFSGIVYNQSQNSFKELQGIYICEVTLFSVLILIQFFVKRIWGIGLGNINQYALRTSYAATFFDYSFATLYIATEIILVFQLYMQKNILHFFAICLIGISSLSMIIVNARTGIAALGVTVIINLFHKILHKPSLKSIFITFLVCYGICFLVKTLIVTRGNQSFFDGSGRLNSLHIGIKYFMDHFLLGTGLGILNYVQKLNVEIPHNFFVQYLAQLGIIAFLPLLFVILSAYKKIRQNNNNFKLIVISISVGAMLIPDIISSHFLSVAMILSVYPNLST